MAEIIPLVHQDGRHQPAPDGSTIAPSLIDRRSLISDDAGNTLAIGSDGGLRVPAPEAARAADLISADTPNAITLGTDSKLLVDPLDPTDLVSSREGNQLTVALDDRLYVPKPSADAADLISAEAGNALSLGADSKLYARGLSADDLISTDINNSITRGSDGGLRAKVVSDDAGNVIQRGSDLGARLTASDLISNGSSDNLLIENGTDHRIEMPKSSVTAVVNEALAARAVVSADDGNLVRKGSDGGAYLSGDHVAAGLTAGPGVSITGSRVGVEVGHGLAVNATTNKLYVNEDDLDIRQVSLAATERILALTNDSVLSSALGLSYDAATGYLTMTGQGGAELQRVFMPGAPQALVSVDLVTDPTGQPAGRYFRYTFSTVEGAKVLYVQVPEGRTTAAGDGITVTTASDVDTVSVRAGDGIAVGAGGVSVQPYAGRGITVDANGVAAQLRPGGGISHTDSGLAIDPLVVPSTDSVTALTTRVTAVEGRADTLSDDLAALQAEVDAIDGTALSVSATAPDPAALEPGHGVLFPAEDLLS